MTISRSLALATAVTALSVASGILLEIRDDSSATPGVAPESTNGAPPVGMWRVVFEDDFDRDHLDRSRWTTCYWWDRDGCTNRGNRELQWYLPRNVSVHDGELLLQARRERVQASDGRSYPYSSGMVTTGRPRHTRDVPPGFAFRYGRVAARMWMPRGQGLWPAFWLLPVSHESRPEIDVIEVLGHEPAKLHAHFHYWLRGQPEGPGRSWWGPDTSGGWHVYELRWSRKELVWLVDGEVVWTFTDSRYVPHEPMYLLVNLAVGGDWPGAPSRSTFFPARLRVDYVRVWQPGSQPADTDRPTTNRILTRR